MNRRLFTCYYWNRVKYPRVVGRILSNIKIKPAYLISPVLCLLAVIFLIIVFVRVCNSPYMTQNITDISDQWHYYTDYDATPKPIRLPCGTEGIYLNENWYITHTLADKGKDAAIMFRSDYLRVIAELDGEEIYCCGYEETSFASPGKKLILIPLPENYAGKEITLTLTPTMNLRAYSIYMGDEASLIAYAVGKSIPVFVMAIFVFLLGATLLCVYFIHRKNNTAISADLWFGVFVVLVGLFIPGKSFLFLILLGPIHATFMLMIVNFLIPCSVLLFVYTSCSTFKIPVIIALCIHIAGYLPTALMQIFTYDAPTKILAVFVHLVPVYYGLSVWAFIREVRTGRKKYQRLKWAGLILIFMVLAGRTNSILGNPLHLSDVEIFAKIGLLLFIIIEVVGRINNYFKEKAQILADFQASQVKNRLALEHFDDIKQYMAVVHKLNHDINHHFNALRLLMDQGDLTRAREYLTQLTGNYPLTKQITYTKNQLLNYIMGYTYKEAAKKNIQMTHSINLPEFIRMDDSDFYSLFINITDNAIEACATMENIDNRTMELTCNMKNGFMYVLCKNSKENDVIMEDGKYISTKSHDVKHGLGIGIIERIVEKYNGVLDIEHDKNWFVIKLVLKAE